MKRFAPHFTFSQAFDQISSSGASGDLHHTMLWYFFRFNDHDYINLSTFKYRTASKVHVRTSPKYKKRKNQSQTSTLPKYMKTGRITNAHQI